MTANSIPGFSRNIGGDVPRQVIEARVRTIDGRRAQLEAILIKEPKGTPRWQEMNSEYGALGSMRADCMNILSPVVQARRSPELARLYSEQREADLKFLRMEIANQTLLTEHQAEKEEAAGNFRQARICRLSIPEIPERVAREYGKNLNLLSEV